MASQSSDALQRLRKIAAEGQDNLGAFELPLGAAVLVGWLINAVTMPRPWLGAALFCILIIAALGYGGYLEYRWFHILGRRRFRGTLLLAITWLAVAWAALLSSLLIGLAYARGWDRAEGWAGGLIWVTLVLGLYHIAQGVRLGVRRWTYLGGVLCLWAVLLPALPLPRQRIFVAGALLVGGMLLISGYWGYRAYLRQRAADAPSAESGRP